MMKMVFGVFMVGMMALGIYAYLGGFRQVELDVITCEDLYLIGVEYKGTPQDEELHEAFNKVELQLGNWPLSTVYFMEPAGKRDTLHLFVGMERAGFSGEANGWDKLEYTCEEAVKASMEMHRLVMPSPGKVKEKLNAFAKEKGLELQGVYIDQIHNQGKVVVLAPIK